VTPNDDILPLWDKKSHMWLAGAPDAGMHDSRITAVFGAAPTVKAEKAWRILVVDDNADAAALLAVLLRLEGHEVETAADGSEAVDRAEQFRPEVVIMDLEMPGVDGLEASRRIRARPWGNTVLIAALTGWSRDIDRRRAREAGVDLHFVKPIDTASLLGWVTRSMNSPRSIRPPGC
jgi:CheY-like chemotaxis protein